MTEKKSVFITGAASGIGKSTALLFAQKGWFVGLFDINREGLDSLVNEIGTDNLCSQVTDVTDLASVQSAVQLFTEKTGGSMDLLFNNAGILRMGFHEDISIEDHALIVDINFKGILYCIHASLDALKKTPGAHIVNMSSASAIYGTPQLATYSATKHAVRGLTEALDIEFERHDITVSDIMPVFVDTPMVNDAEVKAASLENMSVNITPDQVALKVWKAAHSKGVHYKMGASTKLMAFAFWLLPFIKRSSIKMATMPKN